MYNDLYGMDRTMPGFQWEILGTMPMTMRNTMSAVDLENNVAWVFPGWDFDLQTPTKDMMRFDIRLDTPVLELIETRGWSGEDVGAEERDNMLFLGKVGSEGVLLLLGGQDQSQWDVSYIAPLKLLNQNIENPMALLRLKSTP